MSSKAGKKPRKPGTFQEGWDQRRNTAGNCNHALQSYEVRFNNALAEKLPAEEFAGIVAEEVRRHRPGAREFAGKHLIGEPTQKHDVNIRATLSMADLQKSRDEYRTASAPK